MEKIPEFITATASAAQGFDDLHSIMALMIICACGVVALWLHTKNDNDKTAERTANRDAQITELRVMATSALTAAADVKKTVGEHISKDDDKAEKIFNRLRAIENDQVDKREFHALRDDVHRMDKKVVEIYTMVKERFK